jgi:phosphoribosylformimino-5-aminoimidazole carboxamide ribotide isomerase
MEVIPVIDLLGGVVVRARHGERAAYRPIETPLAETSDAVDIVAGLLGLFPFRRLYIADLDAIEGRRRDSAAIGAIEANFPALALWIDNGCRSEEQARDFLADHPSATLVLGSESQRDRRLVRAFSNAIEGAVLSLDFRNDTFLGPGELLDDAACWPPRLIVMTLARVGGDSGPDFERLSRLKQRAGSRAVYLAGGVRGRADAEAAHRQGATGVLVASSLHDGRLTREDLAALATLAG